MMGEKIISKQTEKENYIQEVKKIFTDFKTQQPELF